MIKMMKLRRQRTIYPVTWDIGLVGGGRGQDGGWAPLTEKLAWGHQGSPGVKDGERVAREPRG